MTNTNTTKAGERTQEQVLTIVEHDLPAYWASYLINGDSSGIHGEDMYEADKFLADHNLPMPSDCRPAGFGKFFFSGQGKDLGCELETYSFLIAA